MGGSLRGAAAVGARWARCPLSAFPLGMSALGTPGCPIPAPRGQVAECALGPQFSRPYLLRAPGFLRLARRQNQILSLTVLRKPFSTELLQSHTFALLIENWTRTQLGPLRSPVRPLHSFCRLRIVFALAGWAAPLQKASPSLDSAVRPAHRLHSVRGRAPRTAAPAAPRRPRCPAAPFSLGIPSAALRHLTPVPMGPVAPRASPSFQAWLPGRGKMFDVISSLVEEDNEQGARRQELDLGHFSLCSAVIWGYCV